MTVPHGALPNSFPWHHACREGVARGGQPGCLSSHNFNGKLEFLHTHHKLLLATDSHQDAVDLSESHPIHI